MRTTINIDDMALAAARARAAETGKALGEVVSDALRMALIGSRKGDPRPIRLPVIGGGGVRPGVDLNNNAQIQDILDGVG